MCKTNHPQASSERQKWDKIFNGLVKMLKSQQEQLETLVKERSLLEAHLKMQHEKWVSDVRLYEDHISHMKSKAVEIEKVCFLDLAKSHMAVGFKQREASLWKLKYEYADDELADYRDWFDLLVKKPEVSEGEMRRLKLEYNKLAAEKKSTVSAFLGEKEKAFVWNQFNVMEDDLTSKIKSKHAEVDRANETIEKLLDSMEQLQSSKSEKDETIALLRTKIAEMEAGSLKMNVEISSLNNELERLKKSRSDSAMPVLNCCTAGATASNAAGSSHATTGIKGRLRKSINSSVTPLSSDCTAAAQSVGNKNGDIFLMKKQATQVVHHVNTEKGSRSSKRKAVEVTPILDTPKLFSSKFKVPKLKNSSSHLHVR